MRMPRAVGIVVIGAVFVVALFCEWAIARSVSGIAFLPPVTLLAVLLIMLALPFSLGLWVAWVGGFLIDSVALPPFGATILLFLFLACAIEAGRAVMAERKSYLAKIAMVAGLSLLAYGVAPLARAAAALLKW